MFDFVPIPVWLLIAIAVIAIAPIRYVFEHVAHAPERRDITQPPEDLSWRTFGKLVRNLAILAVLGALAVFIFTPTAAKFAQSRFFAPMLMSGFGAIALFSVATGLLRERISPLIRGISNTYERATQPKRFWASISWNSILGVGFTCLAAVMAWEGSENQCFELETVDTAQTKLSACNELLGEADSTDERANILADRGMAYHLLGDYQNALSDYSQAILFDPQDSYSLYNRGLIHAELGDWQRALGDYNASLKLRPNNADGYLNRGLIYLDAGQFDNAIADFTLAHRREPKNPWPLANRGIAYAWKADRALASKDFDQVRKRDPSNQVLLRGEALLEIQEGDLQSAIVRLTKALENDPKDTWSLRKRADAYWELGEREKAWADDDKLALMREQSNGP